MHDRRPRYYAAEIMRIPDKKARKHFLDTQVPEHYRGMVETHVRCWWRHHAAQQS